MPNAAAPVTAPRLLTTREAAALVGLSPRTFEGFRVRGDGPPFRKLGRGVKAQVRYLEADVLAWIEAARRTSTSDNPAA